MRHSLSDLSPGQTWLLILLVITALLAGLASLRTGSSE